jgi:hypothetical protein
MKEYFDKFKGTVHEENELKADVPLVDLISFNQGELYLNGDLTFKVPLVGFFMDEINVVGIDQESETIYVGTGECCRGHLYTITKIEEAFLLSKITSVDFNVFGILPTNLGELVSGWGCDGLGVRFVPHSSHVIHQVISSEECCDSSYDREYPRPHLIYNDDSIQMVFKNDYGDLGRTINLNDRLKEIGIDLEKSLEKCKEFKMLKK